MKKFLLTLMIAVGVSTMVNAQTVKRINPFTVEGLDLINATDKQKQQVKDATKVHIEKLTALKKNTDLTAEERLTQHRQLNADRSNQLFNEILTPEQTKFMKNKLREQSKALKASREAKQ